MADNAKSDVAIPVRNGPLLAIDSAVAMAKTVIKHSREYRMPSARDVLIRDVVSAVRHSQRMTDVDSGVTIGPGYADGFLRALESQDDQLQSVIETHGLYFATMAAISQVTQDDSISSVLTLICVAHTWNHTKRSERQRWIASQPRSPFVALTKQLIWRHPKATAKEVWNRLIDTGQQVALGYIDYSIDVTEHDGYLHWEAERTEIDDDEPLAGKIGWQQFPSFVSKCKAH